MLVQFYISFFKVSKQEILLNLESKLWPTNHLKITYCTYGKSMILVEGSRGQILPLKHSQSVALKKFSNCWQEQLLSFLPIPST